MLPRVYWIGGSPYSWRVLLTLELKRIPYETRLLSAAAREHKAAEYRQLNPRGRVPTLVDGDRVVVESLAIMTYLEGVQADPPLFGSNDAERIAIMTALSEFIYYLEPAVTRMVGVIYSGSAREREGEVRNGAADAAVEFEAMDRVLSSRDWLAGDRISAADVCAFPHVLHALRAAGKESVRPLAGRLLSPEEHFPRLDAWKRRIEKLPGYERTYPPHWRQVTPTVEESLPAARATAGPVR